MKEEEKTSNFELWGLQLGQSLLVIQGDIDYAPSAQKNIKIPKRDLTMRERDTWVGDVGSEWEFLWGAWYGLAFRFCYPGPLCLGDQ